MPKKIPSTESSRESVEEKTLRIMRGEKIQNAVLVALYAAAAITVLAAAPNAGRLFKYISPYIGERNAKRRMSQSITRLIRKGMLQREGQGASARLTLTEKGKKTTQEIFKNTLAIKKPRRWDGRWRIVMFDVWERRRSVRDRLRYLLQKIGFVKIQHSVWAYPYDCEEVIALIRAELKVGAAAKYIIADSMEGDRALREHFKLPTG